EQSFVGELVAQLLELQAKRAKPPRLEGIDVELKGPARFVEPHVSAGDDLEAVAWPEANARRGAAEKHGAELRPFVLQREVEVAGGRRPEVRDLADDPNSVETAIERMLNTARELTDGEDARSRGRRAKTAVHPVSVDGFVKALKTFQLFRSSSARSS